MALLTAGGWNIALWIAQVLLCGMFLFAGVMKTSKSAEGLVKIGWNWAEAVPHRFVVFLGVMEILGAIGIVLPTIAGIMTFFVPVAAAGMILVQISAIVLHASRKETARTAGLNLVLLSSAVFVVWGRW